MRVAISSSSTSRTCAPARQRPAVAVAAAAATPNGARAADAPSSAAQRLAALAAAALVLAAPSAALAVDFTGMTDAQRSKLAAAEEAFQQSDTLRALKERSEANRAKNKKAIENKYCYRQAELGVGDCGGLRFIPGVTKSGKQKSPEWLQKALGVEQPEGGATGTGAAGGKTLEELLRLDD